jgi:hypothetical protein
MTAPYCPDLRRSIDEHRGRPGRPGRRLAIAVGDWRLCLELAAAHDGPVSPGRCGPGQAELAAGQSVLTGRPQRGRRRRCRWRAGRVLEGIL